MDRPAFYFIILCGFVLGLVLGQHFWEYFNG